MSTSLDEDLGTVLGRKSKSKRKKKDRRAAEELAAAEAELTEIEEAAEEQERGLLRSMLEERTSLFSTLGTSQAQAVSGTPVSSPSRPQVDILRPPQRPGRRMDRLRRQEP